MTDRRRPYILSISGGLGTLLLGVVLGKRLRTESFGGKVALVTGGSRGLGFLLARELAREGCHVAICSRDAGELEEARKQLAAEGADVYAMPCNMTDRTQVEKLVAAVTQRFGQIDVLVNNAGVIQVAPFAATTLADFKEAMDIMFWGVLYTTLAVLPQMRERHSGSIVNITSIGGKISAPHLLPYSCAKFAAVGLSEGLHAELARDGITVTTIAPGLMRTGSFLNAEFEGKRQQEYTWFTLASTLPLISMDATRAARQIVRATRRGETERVLTVVATLGSRFHGLFPGVTADILGGVNRLLPAAPQIPTTKTRGTAIDRAIHSPLFDAVTTLGRSAARRFNER